MHRAVSDTGWKVKTGRIILLAAVIPAMLAVEMTAALTAHEALTSGGLDGSQVPLEGVTIVGPAVGIVNASYGFTFTIVPSNATPPIVYLWSPPPNAMQGSVVTYAWTTTGTKVITLTATNIGGAISDTHSITIHAVSAMVYLPTSLRRWPPMPSYCRLNPIDNIDGDHSYIVTWCSVYLAETYVLEEAIDEAFSSATEVYSGTGNSYVVTGNGPTRYYYRVKACIAGGCTGWPNVEWVDVLWELEPNNNIAQSNGPLVSRIGYYGYPDDEWDLFYFVTHDSGQITVDLINHVGQGVQLLLFYQSPANLVCRDYEPPYHLDCSGDAGQYYIGIYAVGFTNAVSYTLTTKFP